MPHTDCAPLYISKQAWKGEKITCHLFYNLSTLVQRDKPSIRVIAHLIPHSPGVRASRLGLVFRFPDLLLAQYKLTPHLENQNVKIETRDHQECWECDPSDGHNSGIPAEKAECRSALVPAIVSACASLRPKPELNNKSQI